MIPTPALRSFVQKSLNSKDEIVNFLSAASASWSSTQLFDTSKITEDAASSEPKKTFVPDRSLIGKLMKQAGLPPVKSGSAREDSILRDLENQLVFVDHICEVDTTGLEPLVRLGDPVKTVSFEQMTTPIDPKDSKVKWDPTALAKEKNASFYVLKEGLRHEQD